MDAQKTVSLKTQVVIIGAGPTGLSLAAQLLRYKIGFIILERNEHSTLLSKAMVVQARTLEIFREQELADKAIAAGRITNGAGYFYKGKKLLTIDLQGLGAGLTAFPYALSLEQSKTEKLLIDHLSSHGTGVQWKCTFERFEEDAKGVTVFYSDANGAQHQLEAEYFAGCDGASSPVRHAMGEELKGDTIPKLFYVADVLLKSPVIHTDELFIFMIKKGFVLFFPMEGSGHYRVIGILPDADPDKKYEFESLEPFITQEIKVPVQFEKVLWFSTYKVHTRKAGRFYKDRCFIAGDAAHIHTPAGGQGMNTGIQDAYNLAWKLAGVIKKELNDSVLETYHTERSGNAAKLLKTTDRMFDLLAGVNRFWNFIRIRIFPLFLRLLNKSAGIKKKVFPLLSQTGIAYPDSSLTIKSSLGNIKAGNRMPYFVLPGGENIFDLLTQPVFKILFFGEAKEELPVLKIKTDRYNFKDIPKTVFGKEKGFYILLRPDNHISYIGKDKNAIIEFMKKIVT